MKKMFVVLGLVVMMMFVVSCAPGKAIAGQAVSKGNADTDVDVSNNVRYGDIVNIKSSSNKYWTPEGKAKDTTFTIGFKKNVITANRVNAAEWEKFKIMPTSQSQKIGSYVTRGSKVGLYSLGSKDPTPSYVTAEKAEADFPWALYTYNGKYTQTIGEWEKFQIIAPAKSALEKSLIVKYGTTPFALKTAHNRYVSANPEGGVGGDRVNVGEWELFTFEKAK